MKIIGRNCIVSNGKKAISHSHHGIEMNGYRLGKLTKYLRGRGTERFMLVLTSGGAEWKARSLETRKKREAGQDKG